MKKVDFSQNQIDDKQWKPLISSIFSHQGHNINQFILQECDLDDKKISNIINGISIGLRQLVNSLNKTSIEILDILQVNMIDLSLNQKISPQSWFNVVELFFTLFGNLE
jgi:hypothetical protein